MSNWFDSARFGMFVHWGPSSQRGWDLSWPLVGGNKSLPSCPNVPVDEYFAAAKTFDPVRFDPRALARLARRAGMQYIIPVTKHHDGYAMWHTRQGDFSVEHTPGKRDIVRETLDAARAEGLHTGLYFSLIDWHHPDYPAFKESDKPYRFGMSNQPTPEQWNRFLKFMFAQIRELLTNYGKIEVMWFDGGWERTAEQWRTRELVAIIRELQPGILINDRLPGAADFVTPEQAVPPKAPDYRWETCMTIGESWGWSPEDRDLKSGRSLVHTLCEVAGKGGNLLLNIGPMGDGTIPPVQVDRLECFARWMERNGQGIIGTTAGLEPWQFYGPSTRREKRIYLHVISRPYETISLRGIRTKGVKSVSVLASGERLKYKTRVSAVDAIFNADPYGELVIEVPERVVDEFATTIAVDMEN